MMSFNKFEHLSDADIADWIADCRADLEALEQEKWYTDEYGREVLSVSTDYFMSDLYQGIYEAKQELKRRKEQGG